MIYTQYTAQGPVDVVIKDEDGIVVFSCQSEKASEKFYGAALDAILKAGDTLVTPSGKSLISDIAVLDAESSLTHEWFTASGQWLPCDVFQAAALRADGRIVRPIQLLAACPREEGSTVTTNNGANTMNDQTPKKTVEKACAYCGSTDVWVDASAAWDMATQTWVILSTFDHAYCNNCDGQTTIIDR